MAGGVKEGRAGDPDGSTKVPRVVVPVGVVPLAVQVELIAIPLIGPTVAVATEAELVGVPVGFTVVTSVLAVNIPDPTVASVTEGGAVGVGAMVTGPVALIPKAVPEAEVVCAPAVPLVVMRKIPNSRNAAEATPATFDL